MTLNETTAEKTHRFAEILRKRYNPEIEAMKRYIEEHNLELIKIRIVKHMITIKCKNPWKLIFSTESRVFEIWKNGGKGAGKGQGLWNTFYHQEFMKRWGV